MRQVWNLRSLNLEDCGLTIGSFDGVHLGHQALIRSMVTGSRKAGVPPVVLTFFPHPTTVLRQSQKPFYISSPQLKSEMFENMGVAYQVTQRFDHRLAEMEAGAFLSMLRGHLPFQELWVSDSFTFGKDREGDRRFLEQAGPRAGFKLHVVPPTVVDGAAVSSTRVRQALWVGDVAMAATLLGRPFLVSGLVVSGSGRGGSLGVRTANLSLWSEQALPSGGVYACWAEVSGSTWRTVTNIGVRPTFDEGGAALVVETHLLDFTGDLVGQVMRLAFIARLRDEVPFPNAAALVAQIRADIAQAVELLEPMKERVDG
ncbi:MAG: riboflavin biosynthesis protein RibF [Anaerolineales bacterium]|jgi:riboflavin kinase/FMN adenylyltransferase